MKTLIVTSDLRIQIVDDDPTSLHLYIYSEGDIGEGIVVWPNEIKTLIDTLAEAASILAQDVAQREHVQ